MIYVHNDVIMIYVQNDVIMIYVYNDLINGLDNDINIMIIKINIVDCF